MTSIADTDRKVETLKERARAAWEDAQRAEAEALAAAQRLQEAQAWRDRMAKAERLSLWMSEHLDVYVRPDEIAVNEGVGSVGISHHIGDLTFYLEPGLVKMRTQRGTTYVVNSLADVGRRLEQDGQP